MILYKKDKKYMQNKFHRRIYLYIYIYIYIANLIFKKYEDNRRDQMHWMGSYETSLLIISNHTHHLLEKIIIYHTIYILKNSY